MALTNYSELKDAVASWLKRTDLSPVLDDLIRLAELRIFREVRNQDTTGAYSTTVGSTGTTAAPSDFLGWRDVAVSNGRTTYPLDTTTPNQSLESMDYPGHTGLPRKIALSGDGTSFTYYPFPDGDYPVSGTYYKKPGTLATSVYSLFTNNPDLFLFGALAEAAPFLKDDKRVTLWEAKYQNIKDEVNNQYNRTRFSGRLQMTARGA